MKKGSLIKAAAFFLFSIFLILVYLWLYLFPSITKVNTLKRDIKEYGLKIENALSEKTIFIKEHPGEVKLFDECNSVFSKILQPGNDEKKTFETTIRETGEKAGVYGLKISEEQGEDFFSADPLEKIIRNKRIHLEFTAGLRYGTEFIRLLPLTGRYILVKSIFAERGGASYRFKVTLEHHYLGETLSGDRRPKDQNGDGLIDMNSPLLKRPVHFSPIRIKKTGARSGRPAN